MKKKGIVVIKGGFGNQLFQYCMANYLSQQGLSISIDTSFYKKTTFDLTNNTYRPLVFKPNELGFKKSSFLNNLFYKFLRKINKLNIKFFTYGHFKGYEHEGFELKNFNLFDGYWQNLELLKYSRNFLRQSLSKVEGIKNNLENDIPEFNTLVHIRRNDYVDMNEELDISFYEKALKSMSVLNDQFKYDIFTDDKNWVSKQKIFKNVNNIYGKESFGDNSLIIFTNMLKYKNFIISNSTFSLLASFIKYDEESNIIFPDPWFRTINHQGFNVENWIPIINEK